MTARMLILVVSILAVATTAADAATKKKMPPADSPAQVIEPVQRNETRANVGPYECWTDEGYGRRLPCNFGGK